MTATITNVRPATADEWTSIWRNCEYATYFHSREWAEIWEVYSGGRIRPDPKLVVFSDGKWALLPLSCRRSHRGMVTKYLSSPGGTFGGWISTDELDAEHAMSLCSFLIEECGDLIWRINPYDELVPKARVGSIKRGSVKDDETHTLDLTCGFDALYRSWEKSAVRKACREGVSIKPASTLDDWRSYYEVYEDSLRRWGDEASSVYSWEIFSEMFRRDSPNIELWLSLYQGKIIAGALCFYAKNHVAYWHGAALEEYFHLRPVNLLMYESVKEACEKGYSWFDFNPSGGHEGVKAFKRGFGAQELSCPVVNAETNCGRLAKRLSSLREMVKLS